MKKLLLLITIAGVAFFISCENDYEGEITSLAGTYWKKHTEYDNGNWSSIEVSFTDTHATIVETFSGGGMDVFTGPYTFDPPKVVITGDLWLYNDFPDVFYPMGLEHEGTIKGNTMKLWIQETHDSFGGVTLTKQ